MFLHLSVGLVAALPVLILSLIACHQLKLTHYVRTAHDREVLEFAAVENRILLTHDVRTMSTFALMRISKGLPMAGVFHIAQDMPIGQAIDELALIAEYANENEWSGQVRYIPLR
jgi:hypothetical protein